MEELRQENAKLRHELNEAKSAMAVAECVKESMIELERQKNSLNEELATMRQLLNEAHDEASVSRTSYEHQLAKTKAIVSQLEQENQELRIHLKLGHASQMGAVGGESSMLDKDTILGGAAVLSDATKSFARRMKSNLLPPLGMSPGGDKVSMNQQQSPSQMQQQSGPVSLEDGMKKAYEDTELLKSIVVPLEEQIGALKNKLREADSLLRQHEENQSEMVLGTEGLGLWLQGRTLEEARTELLEKSKSPEINDKMRDRMKESIYLALLSARFSLLNSEMSAAKRETREVADLLDKERVTVKNLKQEAVIANSEMVRCQKEHMAEISRIHSVLTDEQKVQMNKPQSPDATSTLSATNSSADSSPSIHESFASDDSMSNANMTRIVSNVEWEELQKELQKVRALLGVGDGDGVVGSDQYRALQTELIEVKKQKAQLQKQVDKFKEELKEEAEYRREVETKWNEKAEQHRAENDAISKKSLELEDSLSQLRLGYNTMYEATRVDLQTLTKDRERIVRELKRLQDENDILVGKHSAKAEEMQNEVINLPEKMEDMHLLLLNFRENLITAKIAKERVEEKLKNEIGYLKGQMHGEEQNRKTMEDQYTEQIAHLQENIHRLEAYRREFANEQKRRKEMEGKEEEQRQSFASLNQEVEVVRKEKVALETKVQELKGKTSRLQQELDNSVAVQTDFVRLSQSLQMELEKIRQSEKEVCSYPKAQKVKGIFFISI